MKLFTTLAVSVFLAVPAFEASAATYSYVGSWAVNDGPNWISNPQVYSGQEAAALLFGGSAADYVISTVSNLVADINFSAWLDGWGDDFTYAFSGNPAAQGYSLDITGLGYDGCSIAGTGCFFSAYSAYVSDHGVNLTNYAFKVDAVAPVPVPAAGLLLIGAIGGLGFVARRRAA